jgi:hypothetical protein
MADGKRKNNKFMQSLSHQLSAITSSPVAPALLSSSVAPLNC